MRTNVIAGLVVLAIGVAASAALWPPCSGWRGCYLLLHRIENGQSDTDQYRKVLVDHFAASADKFAFSVLMADSRSVGMIVADRHSGVSRLISESGAHLGQPYFSTDGRRFLLVRARYDSPQRQLLSCQIATWQCEVVVQTGDTIMFPVEIDAGTILYASSPMRIAVDGRKLYQTYDFYIARTGGEPARLSNYRLYELGWLSVVAGKIVFGAEAAPGNPVLPRRTLHPAAIYAVKFDDRKLEILPVALPLTPIFQMDTISIRPAMSPDGQRVAFLNVESVKGRYHYNMAVASLDGAIQHYVKVEGIFLSHGAFVGDKLFFGELFKDHYRVRQLDLKQGTVDDVLTFDYSAQTLEKLEPISLRINDGARSALRRSSTLPN